jgi:hypothetical protein
MARNKKKSIVGKSVKSGKKTTKRIKENLLILSKFK